MDNSYVQPLALSSFQRMYRIIGTAVLCVAINLMLINILPEYLKASILRDTSWVEDISVSFFLLWGVIIAPAWETVFQSLPTYMLNDNPSKSRVVVYLCMSAFPFAGIHAIGYSMLYAVILLPVAFVLAYTYYYFHRRNQMPYVMTAIVHGLINLFSYYIMQWTQF